MKPKTKLKIKRILAGSLAAVQVLALSVFINVINVEASTEETLDTEETKSSSNTSDKSAQLYSVDIYIHKYNNITGAIISTDLYTYEGLYPLLAVNEFQYHGDYITSSNYNCVLYTAQNSGSNITIVCPTMTYVSLTEYNSDGTVNTVTEKNTAASLDRLTYGYSGNYSYASEVVENTANSIYYVRSNSMDTSMTDGLFTLNYSSRDVAYGWFYLYRSNDNTKPSDLDLKGYKAFNCASDSRSLLVGWTYKNCGMSVGLSNARLEDNVFTFDGSIPGNIDPENGGILVRFSYDGYSDFVYRYYLPLTAGSYTLNLADVETHFYNYRDCKLKSISFYPIVRMTASDTMSVGTGVSYSYDTLLANGCFEEGGNPIVSDETDWSPDKSGNMDPADDTQIIDDSNLIVPEDDETGIFSFINSAYVGFKKFLNDVFLEKIISFFTGISDKFKTYLEAGFTGLTDYFNPGEDFSTAYLEAKLESLRSKFPFIQTSYELIERIKDSLENIVGVAPKIRIPFSDSAFGRYGVSDFVLDFSFLDPYQENFHMIVSGFMYVGFGYSQYFKLKSLIKA